MSFLAGEIKAMNPVEPVRNFFLCIDVVFSLLSKFRDSTRYNFIPPVLQMETGFQVENLILVLRTPRKIDVALDRGSV